MTDWLRTKASKDAMRRRLAALPIAEKLKIVEELAERARLLRKSKPRSTRG